MTAKSEKDCRKKVLVVDDEPNVRLLLNRNLANDYTVIQARDGRAAVDLAVAERPDIVVMDVFMPDMDGYTACHHLKSNPITCKTPVIILTGVGHELNVRFAEQVGADAYVTKPFSQESLKGTIEGLLADRK